MKFKRFTKTHFLKSIGRVLLDRLFGKYASEGVKMPAQYAKLGISLRCANTDRVNGWAEILQRFGDVAGGVKPTLYIHKRCGRLLETLPALQHDPNRPEDVLKVDCDEDGIGGDDAADVLRYLVATKSRTITQRKLRGV
jgi:hypothetical protein